MGRSQIPVRSGYKSVPLLTVLSVNWSPLNRRVPFCLFVAWKGSSKMYQYGFADWFVLPTVCASSVSGTNLKIPDARVQ